MEFPYHWDKHWCITCLESLKIHKYTIYGPPLQPLGGPKALFKGPGRPLTYQYYAKMCSNELPYLWDQLWYLTCLESLKIHKYTIYGPPGEHLEGPEALFKGPGGALTYQYYDKLRSNKFSYLWDQFWYITCLQFFKLYKFTFLFVIDLNNFDLLNPIISD